MRSVAWVLLVLVTSAAGCKSAVGDPNDSTNPTVVVKVRQANGQYEPMSESTLAAKDGVLQLIGIATDPEGVEQVTLEYLVGNAKTCVIDGAIQTGSFAPQGGPANKTLGPGNQVFDKLAIPDQIQMPLTCTTSAGGTPGVASDYTIIVTCKGINYSSNPNHKIASATLTVHVK